MAMNEYATFSKALELKPNYQMQFSVISKTLIGGRGGFYHSAEMHSVYWAAPSDLATKK